MPLWNLLKVKKKNYCRLLAQQIWLVYYLLTGQITSSVNPICHL